MGFRNVEELENPLKLGGVTAGNYTEIATDGTRRLRGTSTCFKDMVGDLFGRRLNSNVGKIDYDYDNNALKFQSSGSISNIADRVGANLEINHEFKAGLSITFDPHIHWFQPAPAGVLDVTPVSLTMRYRLVKNGEGVDLTTPVWTTVTAISNTTNNVFDNAGYVSGTHLNQITKFPSFTVDCGISDTIQFQMAREDAETPDMLVYFMDLHGEVDSDGSETPFSKLA